jgi:hypothetical protein
VDLNYHGRQSRKVPHWRVDLVNAGSLQYLRRAGGVSYSVAFCLNCSYMAIGKMPRKVSAARGRLPHMEWYAVSSLMVFSKRSLMQPWHTGEESTEAR